MKRRIFASLTATAAVAASILISSAAPAAAQTATDSSTAARSSAVTPNDKLPLAIQVTDPKLKIVATLRGIGKQVYTCGADGKYALREPVAVLFDLRGNAGIHGKGPFWASFDGSRVDGSTTVPPVSVPQTGTPNIAWLKVTGNPVPDAPGVFSKVAFIQRIDTKGGVAPASCTAPSTVSVDYSTNYVFWAPK